jgi:hypothetical protein
MSSDIGSDMHLLYHSEIRGLSQGNIVQWVVVLTQ